MNSMRKMALGLTAAGMVNLHTAACDMHGFGFGMYAKPGAHSFGSTSASASAKNQAKIVLRHPYFTNLESGNEKTVEIAYSVPPQITDAKMTVTTTDGMMLMSDDAIELSELKGTVPVTFVSDTLGRHQLVVKVNGNAGDQTVNQIRHISVMVK